jgi:hypothetical protein
MRTALTMSTFARSMENSMTQTVDRRRRTAALAVLLALIALIATATQAQAALDVTSFTGSVLRADGSSATQAGGHPYSATTTIEVATRVGATGLLATETLKDLHVALPPGFIGDPTATPRCSEPDFNNQKPGASDCPPSTQVGVIYLNIGNGFGAPAPIYNLVPSRGVPAVFGFNISSNTVRLVGSVRTGGDYGVTIDVKDSSQFLSLIGTRVTFWGVPADPGHDFERYMITPDGPVQGAASDGQLLPFLTNPANCSAGLLSTGLRANSWENPGVFATASFDHDVNGAPLEVTGCDRVPFDPSMTVRPVDSSAGSPSGLSVGLQVPQTENPYGIASSSLKKAVVRLPVGMTVSASAADGLDACSPAQIGLDNAQPAACPDGSKIGTVTVDTPLLDDPLSGSVFLARQHDNPFGSLLALYIVVEGSGVVVKLPGRVEADPVTGQLTATFDDNPQLAFSDLKVKFDGGARAPLASPRVCGTYTTHTTLVSWSGKTVELDDPFVVDQNCDQAGRFEPSLNAGVVSPQAAGSSPFSLSLSRPNGQRAMTGVSTVLPLGLLGSIKDVPLCDAAQAAVGTCGDGSRVGSVVVSAGAGTRPVVLPQAGRSPTAVYLAGPYNGAPYSLSIVVPAQAGPFDLGNVVVRAGIYVDPITAQVTVKSDPLPTILQGIPVDAREIRVTIDRAGFMRNPTNCTPQTVGVSVGSAADLLGSPAVNGAGQGFATQAGGSASLSNPFGIANCATLDLKPKLSLSLTGKGQTTDNKHPGVVASLKQTLGQSNLKKVTVTLPLSLALDPDNAVSDGLCSFVEGSKPDPQCPKSSIVGTATARTPILDQPLTGPVYFTKNERKDAKTGRSIKTLPKLVIPLKGNGVALTLTGTSAVPDGEHLVTTFDAIPDAPVSDFTLNIAGGKKGILVVSHANLCTATQVAEQEVDGQNGKQADSDITMSTPCPFGIAAGSHTATALKLTVGGIGAGKVSVSGKGLTKATKTITNATAVTLQPKLSSAIRHSLARGHDVKVRVTVSFTPKGTKKAKTTHKTITIHGAKKTKR